MQQTAKQLIKRKNVKEERRRKGRWEMKKNKKAKGKERKRRKRRKRMEGGFKGKWQEGGNFSNW